VSGRVIRGPSEHSEKRAGTYLDRIVPLVRRGIEERKRLLPQTELEAMVPPDARPSFAAALSGPGVSLIAEVKRASPSKGTIRPDLDVGGIVETYERAGVAAVSVLTEEDYFLGSVDDLRTAVACTHLPVLRKDFIFDPYQVHEARVYGASALLLIAALLSDDELVSLTELAAGQGLEVLLEVHNAEEMSRALQIDGAIIGINNRDLRTFEVSLETTARLAGYVPPGRLLVAESGIWDRADVEALAPCGVDAVLVGESILRTANVEEAVLTLLGRASPVVGTGGAPARGNHVSQREDR